MHCTIKECNLMKDAILWAHKFNLDSSLLFAKHAFKRRFVIYLGWAVFTIAMNVQNFL